jgi:hypothetical protein
MGFTRYWTINGGLDENKFIEFSKTCQILVDELGVPLDGVIINDRQVRFNGVDEDAHETFHFLDNEGFNFCKTNVKPYDIVVCGCLYVAKIIFGDNIKINQDCDQSEDEEQLKKVISILRDKKINLILEKSLSN